LTAEGAGRKVSSSDQSGATPETIALVIDGCLYALLGGPASSAFRSYLKRERSTSVVELTRDPEGFTDSLKAVFGDSAVLLEDFMARSLVKEFDMDEKEPSLEAVLKKLLS
jgi:hypothetical protein